MNINNPLYKNQGIHVSCALFTVIKKEIKVLLLKRSNEPYNGYWMLPGGAAYNNEDCETAMQRGEKHAHKAYVVFRTVESSDREYFTEEIEAMLA